MDGGRNQGIHRVWDEDTHGRTSSRDRWPRHPCSRTRKSQGQDTHGVGAGSRVVELGGGIGTPSALCENTGASTLSTASPCEVQLSLCLRIPIIPIPCPYLTRRIAQRNSVRGHLSSRAQHDRGWFIPVPAADPTPSSQRRPMPLASAIESWTEPAARR